MSSMPKDTLKDFSIQELQTKYKLDIDEIFDLAQTFFNEKAEKAFHLSFDDRIDLSALMCVKKYGKFDKSKTPVPGFLDIIGQRRNARWEALSNMKPNEAQTKFINRIYDLCPLFMSYLEAYSRSKGSIAGHYSKEMDVSCPNETVSPIGNGNQHCFTLENEAEIRAALNAQTESQFQSYASLHHPDDPVKRAELIAQLQERHFHEYVAYLQRRYLLIEQSHLESNSPTTNTISSNVPIASDSAPEAVNNVNGDQATNTSTGIPATEINHTENQPLLNGTSKSEVDVQPAIDTQNPIPSCVNVNSVSCSNSMEVATDNSSSALENKEPKIDPFSGASLVVHAPTLWTRGEVKEFKQCLAEDEESVIRISSGEVYSVRVQTHPAGTSIVWEFATDDYDIGFGLFFEWAEPISDPEIMQNRQTVPANSNGKQTDQPTV
uniref:ACB domain-containing protein n=1 Tax=Trichobilharzia regenti TaxID=157069 RepID=A0AA85JHY2_TRIRE|nr:unnamed protein product [Trichobilharzia regenti]